MGEKFNIIREFICDYSNEIKYIITGVLIPLIIHTVKKFIDVVFGNKSERSKSKIKELSPQQLEVVKGLSQKFNRLEKIVSLRLKYYDEMSKNLAEYGDDEIDDSEEVVVEIKVVDSNVKPKSLHDTIFKSDEIMEMYKFDEVYTEISTYISDNEILLPKKMSDLVEGYLLVARMLITFSVPHLVIRSDLQKQGYTPEDSAFLAKFITEVNGKTNFTIEKAQAAINKSSADLKKEFRKFIGVE